MAWRTPSTARSRAPQPAAGSYSNGSIGTALRTFPFFAVDREERAGADAGSSRGGVGAAAARRDGREGASSAGAGSGRGAVARVGAGSGAGAGAGASAAAGAAAGAGAGSGVAAGSG